LNREVELIKDKKGIKMFHILRNSEHNWMLIMMMAWLIIFVTTGQLIWAIMVHLYPIAWVIINECKYYTEKNKTNNSVDKLMEHTKKDYK